MEVYYHINKHIGAKLRFELVILSLILAFLDHEDQCQYCQWDPDTNKGEHTVNDIIIMSVKYPYKDIDHKFDDNEEYQWKRI